MTVSILMLTLHCCLFCDLSYMDHPVRALQSVIILTDQQY